MRDTLRRWLPTALTLGVGAGLLWFIDPISRTESHSWRMGLSILGIALVFAWPWLPSWSRALRVWRQVALLASVLGIGAYYTFSAHFAESLGDHTDPTYYYLNSKYFDELGYFGIYEAMMLADAEGVDHVSSKLRQVRNLRDYQLEPARDALARAPEVKARFTPERWASFSHDAEWFLTRKSQKSLVSNFFIDHGYNPPPAWTLVGGTLSSWIPVEQVKLAAMVDVGICGLMFVAIAWAFGIDGVLLAMLWWVCTVSGRWPVMGQSILRFDWVAAIAVGICMLKRGRPALGGGFLTWAVLSRVFPAVFWACGALGFGLEVLRRRALVPAARSFALGTLVVALGVSGLALIDVGVEGYKGSAENLRMHDADPEAYSSQKVGLGDAVFFRGETTRAEMRDSPCGFVEKRLAGVDCRNHGDAAQGHLKGNGIAGKGVMVHGIKPLLRGAGLIAIAFIVLIAVRTRKQAWELVPLGTMLVWVLTTPSYYYYTLRIALVLGHLGHLERRRDRVGLALLFGIEAISNHSMTQGWERYTTTGTMSWLLGGYFLWWTSTLAWEAWRTPRD